MRSPYFHRLASKKLFLSLAFTLILPASLLLAQLSTPLILRSGMVVQRDTEIPVWGKGSAGSKVIAELNGIKDSVLVESDGNWRILLPSMVAGGPYELAINSGNESLLFTDVYVGDVWIASGQSNMAWQLRNSNPPEADGVIDGSETQLIRQFLVPPTLKNQASETLPPSSRWTPAISEHTPYFSGVAYYFAKYLHAQYDIPIGIINSSFGGTSIEAWMSAGMLGYDEQDLVIGDGTSWLQPTVAYNAMLHPLLGVPAKGFIWYQGESNAGSREKSIQYRELFSQMIESWREKWGMGDLPFLWAQLANFNTPANEDSPGTWDGWPLIRESQSSTLALPNTGEAITIDVGEVDIHPPDKQTVGKRLSLVAQKVAYDETLIYSGPRYKSHRILENGKVEISFDHIGGGLLADSSDTGMLKWFSFVRPNGAIVRAKAQIDGEKVIVWHDLVKDALAIRYAWETNPVNVNFYNAERLPAAPFYIYVQAQELKFQNYQARSTHLDRGESTLIRWEVLGCDSLLLNDSIVATKSAMRVWPEYDSVFTLVAFDSTDHSRYIERSIEINVRQPIPIIEIFSSVEGILPLDSSIYVRTEISEEGGDPIERVEFYLDDSLVSSDFEAPFEWNWTSDTKGFFLLKAKVYNELGISTFSNEIVLDIKELIFERYEAENARYIPTGQVKNSDLASNGKYLHLGSDWKLYFDSIHVDTSDLYMFSLAYLLDFGTQKAQKLWVNDSLLGIVLFEGDNDHTWYNYNFTASLDSGYNRLMIENVWNYMSFDYLEIGREEHYQAPDTSTIDTSGTDTSGLYLQVFDPDRYLHCYPNPAGNTIFVEIPSQSEYFSSDDPLQLHITDISGRRMLEEYISPERLQSTSPLSFSVENLPGGLYFIKIRQKNEEWTQKILKHHL